MIPLLISIAISVSCVAGAVLGLPSAQSRTGAWLGLLLGPLGLVVFLLMLEQAPSGQRHAPPATRDVAHTAHTAHTGADDASRPTENAAPQESLAGSVISDHWALILAVVVLFVVVIAVLAIR